jgi:hypothetical protein
MVHNKTKNSYYEKSKTGDGKQRRSSKKEKKRADKGRNHASK